MRVRVLVTVALVAAIMMVPTSVASCGSYSYFYLPTPVPILAGLGGNYHALLELYCWQGPFEAASAEFTFSRGIDSFTLELNDEVFDDPGVLGCLYDTGNADELVWSQFDFGLLYKGSRDGEAGDLLQIFVPPASTDYEVNIQGGTVGSANLECD